PGVLTTGTFGQRIQFKVRITQVDAATTRVQARVWLEGTTEPTTWQRDATDTTVALQGPGSLHIGIRQNGAETIGSEARVHEYEVRSIVRWPSTTRPASGTARAGPAVAAPWTPSRTPRARPSATSCC